MKPPWLKGEKTFNTNNICTIEPAGTQFFCKLRLFCSNKKKKVSKIYRVRGKSFIIWECWNNEVLEQA
jgi:hypothetical protein